MSEQDSSFPLRVPLSLYIHLPWCVHKCPYCDFNSYTQPEQIPEKSYVDALIRDLETGLPRIRGRRIISVFIGGGTPSLFSAQVLGYLLEALRVRMALLPDTEITLEANPGTFEQARFADFQAIGINRLSIGIQSFNDDSLAKIGRIHDGRQAIQAVEIARVAGFDNLNLDLMYGLPGQTPQAAATDLQIALSFEPEHLSYYQLTIEPHTAFHHRPPVLPDEDRIFELHESALYKLQSRGYTQYEVSAYAKHDKRCRHNLNYWTYGDYLGIGAGAHGKLTHLENGRIYRCWKQRQPQAYMQAIQNSDTAGRETEISISARVFEFMLNALRLREGFAYALFEERTGLSRSHLEAPLQKAVTQGLVEKYKHGIRPSELGWRFLNDLIGLFLTEEK